MTEPREKDRSNEGRRKKKRPAPEKSGQRSRTICCPFGEKIANPFIAPRGKPAVKKRKTNRKASPDNPGARHDSCIFFNRLLIQKNTAPTQTGVQLCKGKRGNEREGERVRMISGVHNFCVNST